MPARGLPLGNIGGGEGARTPDLRLAKPALCQTELHPLLKSLPTSTLPVVECSYPLSSALRVGLRRFELLTSRLSGVRSNQLSYRPRTAVFYRKIKPLDYSLSKWLYSTFYLQLYLQLFGKRQSLLATNFLILYLNNTRSFHKRLICPVLNLSGPAFLPSYGHRYLKTRQIYNTSLD